MAKIIRTKTEKSVRDIPLSTAAEAIFKAIEDMSANEYIFMQANGKLAEIDTISNNVRLASKAAGVDFRMYNCRHQFDTDIRTDLRTVTELMGHSSAEMSIGYARSDKDKKRKAIDSRK